MSTCESAVYMSAAKCMGGCFYTIFILYVHHIILFRWKIIIIWKSGVEKHTSDIPTTLYHIIISNGDSFLNGIKCKKNK